MSQPSSTELTDQRVGILSTSFLGFMLTQFLGALNDNMFKWLAVEIAIVKIGDGALAIGSAMFVLPFLLFAAPAGYLSDRFSKRKVMIATKFAEVFIMILGIISIWSGSVAFMFGVAFLMGLQSTLFGPAKLGGLPEMLHSEALPAANALINVTTIVAIVAGTVLGFKLFGWTGPDGLHSVALGIGGEIGGLWISAIAFLGVAVLGLLASFVIRPLPTANPGRALPLNPFAETWHDFTLLARNRGLLRVALGVAFFWSLGALAQMNVERYAEKLLGLNAAEDGFWIAALMAALVLGVSGGSLLSGIWSGSKIELGIVPLAALGLALNGMLLFTSAHSYFWTTVWLFLLGFCGGMYDIPLASYLQEHSPPAARGSIFAASNFLTFGGMLLVSGIFYLLYNVLGLGPHWIFLLAGLATIPVMLYMFALLPEAVIRFWVGRVCRIIYRIHLYGIENIPKVGGALIVCNHISWADGVLVSICSRRHVRLVAYSENLRSPFLGWLSRVMGVIPINAADGPKALLRSLQTANKALKAGDLVCIFAEGSITRTGQLLTFQRGMMKIVEGTGAPVIPAYLDEMWGSVFSFADGKFFWKWPRRLPYPVTLIFGKPVLNPETPAQVRQAVQDLGVEAIEKRKPRWLALPRGFLRQCRQSRFRPKLADSSGETLTGGQLLLRTLILKRVLTRKFLAADEKLVGILLPPSLGGILANTALSLARRTSVNLNYTFAAAGLNAHIAACGIKHVLTSRKFVEKLKISLDAEWIYLEDLPSQVTQWDKLITAIQTYALPSFMLERVLGLTRIRPDDLLTVIFTSGSTGEAKGVMLSYHNVGSNIEAIDQLFNLQASDTLLGVLPFFHSFGFTATMWNVLTLSAKGVYHFNPLDARVIGTLCEQHGVTILMSTPTFLRTYHKRCEQAQLAKLKLVVTGAEKLPAELADAFAEKFGVRPSEGYGTTELSPLAAVNVPDFRAPTFTQQGTKPGTVGRPVPNVSAHIVDPDTGARMPIGEIGLLLIKGPNVMLGYLNQPQKTADVIRDGWYVTGDIAKIDEDGHIHITDRLSRFSKIGGEMVPHIKIEELLTKILAEPQDEGPELRAVVLAVPDPRKGERLVVMHKPITKPVDQVCKELSAAGLPNLWIPSTDCFLEVAELLVLGTGKLDLKGMKNLASDRLREPVAGESPA